MRKLLVSGIIAATLLTGCATINEQTTAFNGAIADTVSTLVVLNKPGVYESNPIGFPLTIAAKVVVVSYIHWNPNDLKPEELKSLDHIAGSAWWAAAANNLAILLGASNPLSLAIGLTTGILLYINQPNPKPDH